MRNAWLVAASGVWVGGGRPPRCPGSCAFGFDEKGRMRAHHASGLSGFISGFKRELLSKVLWGMPSYSSEGSGERVWWGAVGERKAGSNW